MLKVAYPFICTYCDVKCRSKYDYDRHKMTAKHRKLTFSDVLRKSESLNFIVNSVIINAVIIIYGKNILRPKNIFSPFQMFLQMF